MINKIYLVSKVMTYSFETMNKNFIIYKDKKEAQECFDRLVSDYIEDCMDYYECSREELSEHCDINSDSDSLFCALTKSGEEEIEIELTEMEAR